LYGEPCSDGLNVVAEGAVMQQVLKDQTGPFRFIVQASDGRWYPSFGRTPTKAAADVEQRIAGRPS
jgi:hypothetical protein